MISPNGDPGLQTGNQAPRALERIGGAAVDIAFKALDLVADHGGGQFSLAAGRSVNTASSDRRPAPGDPTAYDHPLPSSWGSVRRT